MERWVRIAGRSRDYAVVLPQTGRLIVIDNGSHPFLAGDVGIFRVKKAGRATFLTWGRLRLLLTWWSTRVTRTSTRSPVRSTASFRRVVPPLMPH